MTGRGRIVMGSVGLCIWGRGMLCPDGFCGGREEHGR